VSRTQEEVILTSSSFSGMAPVFVPGSDSTPYQKDTVVVGQKSGNLYAMSAQHGELFWTTQTSPGAPTGDLSWGIAVDDGRVYFTVINIVDFTYTLEPSGQAANRSAHGAASLSNGTLLWEVPTPGNGGVAYGPPTVVGDIVLVSKTGSDPNGTLSFDSTVGSLLAFEKRTGKLVASFVLDANFHGGVAVQGQSVLFGTGKNNLFNVANPTIGSFHVMRVRT
jgi:outer membrane protein assembly factor BamB